MAEQETPPEGRKTLGLDRRQLLILGAAAAAGVLWFWWRSRAANQASTADTSSTADTTSADDTGAVTPYPVGGLTEQQLADLEASIAALQGPKSQPPGTPGGKPPSSGGGKPPVKTKQEWTKYTIQRGDTPAKIARKFGIPFKTIWAFNIGSTSPHSAAAKKELEQEGQNRLRTGQWLAIPKKG